MSSEERRREWVRKEGEGGKQKQRRKERDLKSQIMKEEEGKEITVSAIGS